MEKGAKRKGHGSFFFGQTGITTLPISPKVNATIKSKSISILTVPLYLTKFKTECRSK